MSDFRVGDLVEVIDVSELNTIDLAIIGNVGDKHTIQYISDMPGGEHICIGQSVYFRSKRFRKVSPEAEKPSFTDKINIDRLPKRIRDW